jgi:hypothetical protein
MTEIQKPKREKYSPTRCQDRKPVFLRWIYHRVLRPLARREPEGRPQCQRRRRTARLGCCSPAAGATYDYYEAQNTGPGCTSPRPLFDSLAGKPPQPYLFSDKWPEQEVLLLQDMDRNGIVDGEDYAIFALNRLWQE